MPLVAVAAIGAVASVYSANKQSSAAKSAANTQAKAASDANATQLQMYNQSRSDSEPWRQAGMTGLSEYMNLLGLGGGQQNSYGAQGSVQGSYGQGSGQQMQSGGGGRNRFNDSGDGLNWSDDYRNGSLGGQNAGSLGSSAPMQPALTAAQAQQAAFDKFRSNPGYQFGLDQGAKSVQASAAARGGLNSGAALKSLLKFGNDYADQQGYQPYMNRLASLSGLGQTQANNNAALGQNYANAYGNNVNNAAQARANGIYGSANAWSNAASGIASGLGNAVGSYYGGGGGSPWQVSQVAMPSNKSAAFRGSY